LSLYDLFGLAGFNPDKEFDMTSITIKSASDHSVSSKLDESAYTIKSPSAFWTISGVISVPVKYSRIRSII